MKKFLFFLILFVACKAVEPKVDLKQTKNDQSNIEQMPISKSMLEEAKPELKLVKSPNSSINCFSKEIYEANQKSCESENVNWVCGCNSVSYKNECEAKKAGVKSFVKGKCPIEAAEI
ncbi:MAG TPA: hypothetical protein PKD85_22465 [Saprospiraceae bacterium]|nr:hypothetical protein [Saprospiraceae bacterium]